MADEKISDSGTETPQANMLEPIRRQIDAGDHAWAIGRLRDMIGKGVAGPDVHRLLAFAHLKGGPFDAAVAALDAARAVHTTAAVEVAFGRYLITEGFNEAALNCFQAAVSLDPEHVDPLALAASRDGMDAIVGLECGNVDGLGLACLHHGRHGPSALALQYGQKALEARDRQAMAQAVELVPSVRPTGFDPASPEQNIIAYSLFGPDPYYWECAVEAAAMAWAIFPEWRCRFYCDSKISEGVRRRLIRLRAQVYVSPQDSKNWSGLFWRFLAFDDPNVNVVMIRDVDSPFTVRERLAVDDWLASKFPFHVMRDHQYHFAPILAGMWGGWTRLLPPMHQLVDEFRFRVKDRFADQEFLRLNIWPRIRAATLAHDRAYTLGETRLPPGHPTEAFTHIGVAWPRRAPGTLCG